MATENSAELLVTLDRRRLGAIDVVRVTPGGRATQRESLFDPAVLARLSWSGVASLVPGPRLLASVARRRKSL